MTIEVSDADIEVLPARRTAPAQALGQLQEHAGALIAARQWAEVLADPKNELCPALYRGKTGNAIAAILFGAELGLNPTQSLQQVFVVHGMPAIYARTAVALVKGVGIVVQTVSTSDKSVTVRATDPHTGQVEESTWDIARATLAGYTSNKKYTSEPQQMLYAKAAMECCRKIAPDVLLGIPYAREELDLEAPVKVRSERGGVGVKALRDRASAAQVVDAVPDRPAATPPAEAAKPQAEPALSKSAREKWVKSMFAALNDGDCKDKDDQLVVITLLSGRGIDDKPEHRDGITDDELRRVVGTLGAWKKDGDLADKITDVLGDYATEPADAEPAEGDVMVGQAELEKLAQIRAAERYDDNESWFAYVQAATGVLVDDDDKLTSAQAQTIIDLFNADNAG